MRLLNRNIYSVVIAITTLIARAQGALRGDEDYLSVEDGRFWIFYSGAVALVNPESCEIEKTITADHQGNPLPSVEWGVGVYMQYHVYEEDDVVSEAKTVEDTEGYILINVYGDRNNSAGVRVSDAYVFGTVSEKVESIVEVGPGNWEGYGLHTQNEFWSKADEDGNLYVVHLSNINKTQAKVPAYDGEPGHGGFIWIEDGAFASHAYAVTVYEPKLFQIDVATKDFVGSYNYSSDVINGTCTGSHGIAYSRINQHVYTSCTYGEDYGGGILEFDVSTGSPVFVAQHSEINGDPFEVPDGTYVAVTSTEYNELKVLRPQASGEPSVVTSIEVPGRPSDPTFYPMSNDAGEAGYLACMPLQGIPNGDQFDSTGEPVCDYFKGCTGATSASDAALGVCLHNEEGLLLNVTELVTNTTSACVRCAEISNFDNETASCVCTPDCGYCGISDGNFTLNLNHTGVTCVELGSVSDGTTVEAEIIPNSGGIMPPGGYEGDPQCAYGYSYRFSKRASRFDASTTSFPAIGVVFVDLATQTTHCFVELPELPSQFIYAPRTPQSVTSTNSSDTGSSDDEGGMDMDHEEEGDSSDDAGETEVETDAATGTETSDGSTLVSSLGWMFLLLCSIMFNISM